MLSNSKFTNFCPLSTFDSYKLQSSLYLIMAFDLSMQFVASMSSVDGPFCAFRMLALESNVTMPHHFFTQKSMTMVSAGQYGANIHPMAASGGF